MEHSSHLDMPPAPPGREVVRVLWITLLLNLIQFAIKLTVGLISRNLTVISDAMHGLLDAANNVVGIVALKISWRPPDDNHPYGHRKFEALASLAIGGFMTLTCWELARRIYEALTHGRLGAVERPGGMFFGLVGVSMAINIFITLWEAKRGRELRSPLLVADAAHTRSDVYLTLLSFSSLLLAPRWPALDAIFSLIIIGFILHTGWQIVRDNVLLLTDAAQLDPEPIRAVVESIDGVSNCHAIRSHGMPDEVHLDLHIVVPATLTALDTEQVEAQVREALLNAFPEVAEVAIHHQTHQPVTMRPLRR